MRQWRSVITVSLFTTTMCKAPFSIMENRKYYLLRSPRSAELLETTEPASLATDAKYNISSPNWTPNKEGFTTSTQRWKQPLTAKYPQILFIYAWKLLLQTTKSHHYWLNNTDQTLAKQKLLSQIITSSAVVVRRIISILNCSHNDVARLIR